MEKLKLSLIAEDFEEEPIYEDIEAPKFVDLTRADRFLPDDRYWFCSRVGCDLKHEEELDLEAIYKNFALRAMAARSPNLRFQRALAKRQNEHKKCPLSAPQKPSKSRIPKLALLSSVSRKLVDDTTKTVQPPSKPTSTPKPRVKYVAAKYMTTPRVKKPDNADADFKPFNSVRNQPASNSSRILKPKSAAKALFSSPMGIKRLEVAEEMKSNVVCKKKVKYNTKRAEEKDKSLKSVSEGRILVESNYSNEGSGNDQNTSCDDKENAPCSDINRDFTVKNGQLGDDKGAKHDTLKKTKVVGQTMLKNSSKECHSGSVAVKYKKQKLTNPKPFRLRTDERSILKEATLERKHHENDNQQTILNSTGKVQSKGRLCNGIHKPKKTQQALMGAETSNRSNSRQCNLASCKSQQKDASSKISTPAKTYPKKRDQIQMDHPTKNFKFA